MNEVGVNRLCGGGASADVDSSLRSSARSVNVGFFGVGLFGASAPSAGFRSLLRWFRISIKAIRLIGIGGEGVILNKHDSI